MRETILEYAKFNTTADSKDYRTLKLDSIEQLDSLKDLMCMDAIDSLEDKLSRKILIEDIAYATFIFWFDEEGKLEYAR